MTDREKELEALLERALSWMDWTDANPNTINHNYFLFKSKARKKLHDK